MNEFSFACVSILEPMTAPPPVRLSARYMLRKLLTPLTVIVCLGIVTVFRFAVAAQGAAPAPTPLSAFDQIKETASGLMTIVMFLTFVVVAVWYIWKGRDVQQLKDAAAGWKDEVDRIRGERNDAKTERDEAVKELADFRVEVNEEFDKFKKKLRELRRANLRLQGLDETLDDDDLP